MSGKPQPTAPRLWCRVDVRQPDECWEWTGARMKKGYGVISVNGRQTGTHRVAYELHHGPVPDGLHVCHSCDNPPCCNPAHLFAGTPSDNMQDKSRKGRNPGNRTTNGGHPRKLTTAQVVDMLAMNLAGHGYRAIGESFGVSAATVCRNIARLDERNADLARERLGMFITVETAKKASAA